MEEIFGWAKTVGGLRKVRFIGLAKVKVHTVFTLAVYNLTRMATIFGWRLNSAKGEICPEVAERRPAPTARPENRLKSGSYVLQGVRSAKFVVVKGR